MTYCPFCGAELLPGALSFRHTLSLWCAGEERTSPRLRRGSAQLALPILCSRWVYEKGRLPVGVLPFHLFEWSWPFRPRP